MFLVLVQHVYNDFKTIFDPLSICITFLDIPENVQNLQNVVISFTEVITNLISLSLIISDSFKTKMSQKNPEFMNAR